MQHAARTWREAGNRVVRLMIDANEDATDHILAGMMAELGLSGEAVRMRAEGPGPNTHIGGSDPFRQKLKSRGRATCPSLTKARAITQ